MANLIIVCGPQAVGKMTVAESIRDKLKIGRASCRERV